MQVLDLLKNRKEDYDMRDLSHYTTLARMFMYPTSDLREDLAACKAVVMNYGQELLPGFQNFNNHVVEKPLSLQQEYYVSTFDVQPLCTLDIGYVLFGEDYRRGEFMVNIKKEHLKASNDCGSELPDHLTNILKLLPKMKNAELAEELIVSLLLPAISEIILKFRGAENLYRGLLEILVSIMERDYPDSVFERFQFNRQTQVNFKDRVSKNFRNEGKVE